MGIGVAGGAEPAGGSALTPSQPVLIICSGGELVRPSEFVVEEFKCNLRNSDFVRVCEFPSQPVDNLAIGIFKKELLKNIL